ncbi:MAG: hypothetical protein JXB45_00620, partial [Candidatus Krumholzibacteriota bacterium]|nr:hypothetical protein [Candidatus Krumholzibacteriota bacterium]
MKRLITVFLSIVVLTVLPAGELRAGAAVRVNGGFSHVGYGDFNDFADKINEKFMGFTKLNNIYWIPEISAEILYPLVPTLNIGLGAGMIAGSADLSFKAGSAAYEFDHTLRSYPFTLNAFFKPSVPLISIRPYLYGGLGLYYTSLNFDIEISGMGQDRSMHAEFTKFGMGVQGGGGLEFSIVPAVVLDLGV